MSEVEQPTVVVPGSSNDPFSVNYKAPSEESLASPAVQVPQRGVTAAVHEDVPNASETAPTPAPVTAQPSPETAPDNTGAAVKPEELQAMVREAVEKARREAQSAADKRVAQLEKQIKDAQEASMKAEREAKLKDEYLSDEEKARLKQTWELEDTKRELDVYHDQLESYYKSLQVETLSKEYAQFGVTREDLEAIDDADEMERFVQSKELEFHRSGKTVQSPAAPVPTATVVATPPEAPAGASAPTHVGGTAPAPEAPKFLTGQGWKDLAFNLKNIPEVSAPVPN